MEEHIMSESTVDTSNQDGNTNGEATSGAGDEFKAVTSQDDLNRIINDRLTRERAKYADYKDVKAKAARLDEIEAANKSEIEKATEKATAAELERDAAKAEALRLRIAAKHQISDEDADLFLTGTDEATLTKQAERLAQRSEDRKKQGNYVAREGGNTTRPPTEDDAEFARGLLGGSD
jgi:hypothetical protein